MELGGEMMMSGFLLANAVHLTLAASGSCYGDRVIAEAGVAGLRESKGRGRRGKGRRGGTKGKGEAEGESQRS